MIRRLAVVTLLALAGAVTVAAHQKPNFSGTWTAISPADQAGNVIHVKHDGNTLTQSHAAEGPDHSTTYTLDGKETRSVMQSHGQDMVTLSTATWNNEKLTIVDRTTYPDGRKGEIKQVWSLDAKGQLVIEVTTNSAGQPINVTVVHQKK